MQLAYLNPHRENKRDIAISVLITKNLASEFCIIGDITVPRKVSHKLAKLNCCCAHSRERHHSHQFNFVATQVICKPHHLYILLIISLAKSARDHSDNYLYPQRPEFTRFRMSKFRKSHIIRSYHLCNEFSKNPVPYDQYHRHQ